MTIVNWCCLQMHRAIDDSDMPIRFVPKFREIGIQIVDGGDSMVILSVCPWCGSKLPESLRNRWFDELEANGIDPYGDSLPAEYLNTDWYRR